MLVTQWTRLLLNSLIPILRRSMMFEDPRRNLERIVYFKEFGILGTANIA